MNFHTRSCRRLRIIAERGNTIAVRAEAPTEADIDAGFDALEFGIPLAKRVKTTREFKARLRRRPFKGLRPTRRPTNKKQNEHLKQ